MKEDNVNHDPRTSGNKQETHHIEEASSITSSADRYAISSKTVSSNKSQQKKDKLGPPEHQEQRQDSSIRDVSHSNDDTRQEDRSTSFTKSSEEDIYEMIHHISDSNFVENELEQKKLREKAYEDDIMSDIVFPAQNKRIDSIENGTTEQQAIDASRKEKIYLSIDSSGSLDESDSYFSESNTSRSFCSKSSEYIGGTDNGESYTDEDSLSSTTDRNHCVLLKRQGGGSDVLENNLDSLPPVVTRDGIRIRIEASSVSYTDCLIRQGKWHRIIPVPQILGCDLVGCIELKSSRSRYYGFETGDRVAYLNPFGVGGNARYSVAPLDRLVPVPDGIKSEIAVSLIQTFVPAFQCLYRVGDCKVKKGHNVFVTNAHTHFGQCVIKLSLNAGAKVYAMGESKYGHLLKSLGAIHVKCDPEKWLCTMMDTMDVVIYDKGLDFFELAHSAVNEDGKIVCIGRKEEGWFERCGRNLMSIWATGVPNQVFHYDLFAELQDHPKHFARDLTKIFDLFLRGRISPLPIEKIKITNVMKAHKKLEKGSTDRVYVCMPWHP